MLTLSDLQFLVHQLGPATPEITAIIQEAIDSWQVEFDEGISMQIAWEARSGHVLMQCALGQPAQDSREDVYALLLSANRLLTGVADVKLALGDADDNVMLIGEYDFEEATVDSQRDRLSEFLGFAARFSQMIADTFESVGSDVNRPSSFMHQPDLKFTP